MRIIAISDIHGCFEELQQLLIKVSYDPEEDQLIFLGDYIDRGKQSLEVIRFIMEQVKQGGAIALKGNHENMLFEYLNSDDEDTRRWYMSNGGKTTIKSFCKPKGIYSTKGLAKKTIRSYREEIAFLKSLPLYYQHDKFVFSHAGANWYLNDWKKSSENDFLWSEPLMYLKSNETNNTFVFGHMVVENFRKDGLYDPYIFPTGNKIAIDGGCVGGGQLNALIINNGKLSYQSVRKSS